MLNPVKIIKHHLFWAGLPLALIVLINGANVRTEALSEEQDAELAIEQGLSLHSRGEYEKAVELFKRSIAIKPTARGQTYLAWSLSYLGKLDQAIEEARKAIELAPDFGNPYNDIGAYYIEKGLYDEAIPFLEKAMKAKDYCCYYYPHFNLGRIYALKEDYARAIEQFERALKIEPNYLPAVLAIIFLRGKIEKSL